MATTLPPIDQTNGSGNPTANPLTPVVPIPTTDPGAMNTKDIVIGAGALLLIAIVLFFVRAVYVKWLVGDKKRSPNAAGMSGWGLFGALFFVLLMLLIFFLDSSILSIYVIGALGSFALISLIVCVMTASRR